MADRMMRLWRRLKRCFVLHGYRRCTNCRYGIGRLVRYEGAGLIVDNFAQRTEFLRCDYCQHDWSVDVTVWPWWMPS